MLTEVSGKFVKIALAETDADIYLARGLRDRPAARFNRSGQDALYLSPDEESARVAIGQYVTDNDPQRVLLTFEVDSCDLFDLRMASAATMYERASQPWLSELEAGRSPETWFAADELRSAGHTGLIDPSRRGPGLWHITLFRWNEPGAPAVQLVGDPMPVKFKPSQR